MRTQRKQNEEVGWTFNYPRNRYSCQEASQFLKLPLPKLYAIRRNGEIPFIETQGMYLFTEKALVDWIQRNQPDRIKIKSSISRSIIRILNHYLNMMI
jgi:hypothetical protein